MFAPWSEPPCADPHAGWCGGWRRESSGYPIYQFLHFLSFSISFFSDSSFLNYTLIFQKIPNSFLKFYSCILRVSPVLDINCNPYYSLQSCSSTGVSFFFLNFTVVFFESHRSWIETEIHTTSLRVILPPGFPFLS